MSQKVGRKSLQENVKESEIIKFRISDDIKEILAQQENKSLFIRKLILESQNQVNSNSVDNSLLKLMIPAFIESALKISLESEEQAKRLEELIQEVIQ
ncbi:MAG: hypothetical protein A2V66_15520 [Ignavibacteria bacterium RBG_13_36_8]|nr:MAG: hypothetical protein A2V66_15520 [Ignavibacteria bacterium RBG_13_36_8]